MKKKRRSLIEFNKTMSQSYLVEESINGQFGIGEEDEGNNLSYIPEEEREVFIDRAQLSIFELHRRCRRGDIILQPSYQRKDVWTKPKKSKLIESVLRNIPVPSIYFAETREGRWEVVDGQQRLTSFFEFLDNQYPLSQLPVLAQFEKKYFKDLDSYQRKIEDYQLHIFIIKKESHPDIRFDIFERINEGATQLNAQELRNSIYRGIRVKLLIRLSKNPNFIKLVKGNLQEKRLKHQEAVLRFISFYIKGPGGYNGNLNSFLNSTLDENLINEQNIEELENVLNVTMSTIYEVFGKDAFIKANSQIKRINMSLFDILSYSFAIYEAGVILDHKEEIVKGLNILIQKDDEFRRSITSNTLTKKNVTYRFNKWLEFFEKILNGENYYDQTF
ncbi:MULTISPECIES: DUF262 domain-containing protein [Bacillus]|uniref:DUF262 domain-containing protein n=1 Tax=Bacillus TaxID=1386 RepID=UPI00137AB0C9|nr:DUF262 domain-containing protein [Bacillus cereus]UIJ66686.1 DUF262 domain-containing protein [Bacillus cereus]HDR8250467.1 DUF262 domain-containing protein [Bacillus cereus]HDR8252230.1 DUF262 domain-containing protein [Bacillus cereus]